MDPEFQPVVINELEDGLSAPVRADGKYANPWPEYRVKSFWDLIKWMTNRKSIPLPTAAELDEKLPVGVPDQNQLAQFHQSPQAADHIQATWIGHSCFLVQQEGKNYLTDAVFGHRCSPLKWWGPSRIRPVPLTLDQLPHIDFIVISHNHYDHLDVEVARFFAQNSPNTEWIVPEGLGQWCRDQGLKRVVELSWWQRFQHDEGMSVVSVPCQHWSKRNLTNANESLWSSYCILGQKSKVYFSGDTGYCPAFAETGVKYGPFDLGLIPIGAYCPRWIMKDNHIDPAEAIQIHKEIGAKKSIGMHWGTFVLTDEHVLEPPQRLLEELLKQGMDPEQFSVVQHGVPTLISIGVKPDVGEPSSLEV